MDVVKNRTEHHTSVDLSVAHISYHMPLETQGAVAPHVDGFNLYLFHCEVQIGFKNIKKY